MIAGFELVVVIIIVVVVVVAVARVDDVDDELDREDDAGHHPEDSNVGPSVAPTEVVSSECAHSIHSVAQSGGNCADCQVTL